MILDKKFSKKKKSMVFQAPDGKKRENTYGSEIQNSPGGEEAGP